MSRGHTSGILADLGRRRLRSAATMEGNCERSQDGRNDTQPAQRGYGVPSNSADTSAD